MSASAVPKKTCGPSGATVQSREREGSCSLKAAHPLSLLLVVEGDAGPEYLCLLSVHPADSLLYGLAESITMLHEFGHAFARHERHAEAVRRAVKAWRLEVWCRDARSYSPAVTVVAMSGRSRCRRLPAPGARSLQRVIAMGQNKLAGKAFRFGHLGYTNDHWCVGRSRNGARARPSSA
jgi:hypothetical protein